MPTTKKTAKKTARKAASKKVTGKKPAGKRATKKKVAKKKASTKPASRAARYERVYAMTFASIYPLYVNKVEKKGRTATELDQVICWLTGYTPRKLESQITRKVDLRTFFEEAKLHPNAHMITGTICGHRVEEIEESLMRKIRYMDKLVDELAKGRPMEKILRA
jgi:hypothetical protein